MANGWRSTTLSLASKHCPKALEFYERGAPYDRGVFAVGSAAHAILEAVGKAAAARGEFLMPSEAEEVARQECERLIRDGRDFEGVREPPLPSEAVWRGRDLALSYAETHVLPAKYRYEVGLAVNRDWQLVPFDSGAWLRCRIDAVGTRLPVWFEDDQGGPILDIPDYKSSWVAREEEVRTLQRKIQGVLAWIAWGEGHESMRLSVVNFRLAREYELLVFPHEAEGAAVLERWKSDIETEIAAREAQQGPDGSRPAIPGIGCMGCPYLRQCGDARDFLEPVHASADPEVLARQYSVALALVDALEEPLRIATAEEPIQIPGGFVGYEIEEQSGLKRDAAETLADHWLKKTRPSDLGAAVAGIPGLINASKFGNAQARALLTHLYKGGEKERDKRAEVLREITEPKRRSVFGVHRSEE